MTFRHLRVIRVGKVELGEVARTQRHQMVPVGFMQYAFATDLVDLDLSLRAADGDFTTQGVAVGCPSHRGLDMGGLGGMFLVEAECRDKLFIHIQPRYFRNLVRTAPVFHIEGTGEGGRADPHAQQGHGDGSYKAG